MAEEGNMKCWDVVNFQTSTLKTGSPTRLYHQRKSVRLDIIWLQIEFTDNSGIFILHSKHLLTTLFKSLNKREPLVQEERDL